MEKSSPRKKNIANLAVTCEGQSGDGSLVGASPMAEQLKQAAIQYIREGWPIVPCVETGAVKGKPLVAWRMGEGPCRDVDHLKRVWATRGPPTSLAVPTGQPSGLVVVDVDGADPATVASLELPPAPYVDSPRPGHYHLYYCAPNRQCGGWDPAQHVEFKADGQLAYLPPSANAHGTYRWGDTRELPQCPKWLVERPAPSLREVTLDELADYRVFGPEDVQAQAERAEAMDAIRAANGEEPQRKAALREAQRVGFNVGAGLLDGPRSHRMVAEAVEDMPELDPEWPWEGYGDEITTWGLHYGIDKWENKLTGAKHRARYMVAALNRRVAQHGAKVLEYDAHGEKRASKPARDGPVLRLPALKERHPTMPLIPPHPEPGPGQPRWHDLGWWWLRSPYARRTDRERFSEPHEGFTLT